MLKDSVRATDVMLSYSTPKAGKDEDGTLLDEILQDEVFTRWLQHTVSIGHSKKHKCATETDSTLVLSASTTPFNPPISTL